MNVLSLFDGISCGQSALNRAGVEVSTYYASEVDKHAITVTQDNYPNTVQLGDVRNWKEWGLKDIDLIIGGSPCQGFSFAGKQLNFKDPRSALLLDFVDILNNYKPKYFLLENVKMKKEYISIISGLFGIRPVEINSRLVSGQNRVRLYWTNIPNVGQPVDKGISIGKFGRVVGRRINPTTGKRDDYNRDIPIIQRLEHRPDNKCGCLTTVAKDNVFITDSGYRNLTVEEYEVLQTVDIGYTKSISDTQRRKVLGNGWTVDVVAHIFSNITCIN